MKSRGAEMNERHQMGEYEVNRATSLLSRDESDLVEFYHESVKRLLLGLGRLTA